jgi:hypothetical protein
MRLSVTVLTVVLLLVPSALGQEGDKESKRPPRVPPNADALRRGQTIVNPDGTMQRVEVLAGNRVRLADGPVLSREEFDKRRAKTSPKHEPELPKAAPGSSSTTPQPEEAPAAPRSAGQVFWLVSGVATVLVLLAIWYATRRGQEARR